MGISGFIAKSFQNNPITPVIAILLFVLGIVAMVITPKEEDPQIDVTMVDVFLTTPSFSVTHVEQQVTLKAEKILSQIANVEHVYSVSMPGRAVITVQFEVGIKRQEALVKVWDQVMTELHWPKGFGVQPPKVKARGINDVPVLSLTFWSDDHNLGQTEIGQVATSVANVLQRVEGTRNIELSGNSTQAVNVHLDPAKMASHSVDIHTVVTALQRVSNKLSELSIQAGGEEIAIAISSPLHNEQEVAGLVLRASNSETLYLSDIAEVSFSTTVPSSYVQMGFGKAAEYSGVYSAVTLSIAKKEGKNAIEVSDAILLATEALQGKIIPDNVNYTVTRNSGLTAQQKANTLIKKLLFATIAVVILVWSTLGYRAAIIVGIAVSLTLLITLFSSWAWGFTLNRISLFALIFSIGILVDDAIVVVENIHRSQMQNPTLPLSTVIPQAVDEVGSSTILATFTVIAALLPMAFVSGLMGPYMSPIPVNASTGMLLSLIIAFTITPWLAMRMLKRGKAEHHDESKDPIGRFAANVLAKFIVEKKAKANQWRLFIAIIGLMIGVVMLPVTGSVVLKMLPFDNKATMTVTVDMPEGTTAHDTLAAIQAMSLEIAKQDYTIHYQLYSGTNSPITFNGLVRQYYMRNMPHQGEIAVTIVANESRTLGSHDIAKHIRQLILPVAQRHQAKIKVVEEPSGPPTLAPIVAEVYGPDHEVRESLAKSLLATLDTTPDVVDSDLSLAETQQKWRIVIDEHKARRFGFIVAEVEAAIHHFLSEQPVGYLHDRASSTPIPIQLSFTHSAKSIVDIWLNSQLQNHSGDLIALSEFVSVELVAQEQLIYHKNLRPVNYVVADMAGNTDSPLYGMFQAASKFSEQHPDVAMLYTQAPDKPFMKAIKWDGEWQITYETFRDMGLAYGAGLLLIYLLIVGQFKSYRVPLLIMAPIPLTAIGIFPGHWLLGAKFTAPSMIGMIALAGIIVRNSILLVDFIEQQLAKGVGLQEAVIASAQMRARPIILTALAAMIGALFILSDPIFKGLAVSLIFGMAVSSALTLLVIPIAYYRSKLSVYSESE